jgi:ABC-type sulfate transport system permease component
MVFLIYLMLIASLRTFVYLAALIIFGVVFYLFQKFAKHYGWIQYVEAPKRQRVTTKLGVSLGASPASTAV